MLLEVHCLARECASFFQLTGKSRVQVHSDTVGNSVSSGLLQKFSCVLSQIRNSDGFGIKWEVTLSQVKWGDNRDQNLD